MRPDPRERIDGRAVTVWRIAGVLSALAVLAAAGVVIGLSAADLLPGYSLLEPLQGSPSPSPSSS
jgi:hypothetical protein